MAEASVSRQLLVEAVAALEAQHEVEEGDEELADAIEVALDVLRSQLATMESAHQPEDDNLAILTADLSGFTALAEREDVEWVQAAIDAMWQVLDAVVSSWGGRVELHAGDSLVGLFGHPHPRRSDVARALYAALTIQSELALFNERVRQQAERHESSDWALAWPGPDMRIGVHTGPLLFTSPGTGRPRVALGETLRVAQTLEDAAEPGQVLASRAIYEVASERFRMQPVTNRVGGQIVYHVLGSSEAAPIERRQEPTWPLLAGRRDELDFLEQRFRTVVDGRSLHTVLLLAEAGGGKSRLVQELERQARIVHGPLTVLQARATAAAPYSLVRDVLTHRLDLRPQYSRYMKAMLIRRALQQLHESGNSKLELPEEERAADLLSRLTSTAEASSLTVDEVVAVTQAVLSLMTRHSPAILVLEDIHLADRQSLELVEALRRAASDLPVLIIATAIPEVDRLDGLRDLTWLAPTDDPFTTTGRLVLEPLSSIDSRLLAMRLLGELTPVPLRLVDLVVAEARGNPLHIEQLVELFVAAGVIVAEDRLRVDMDKAERLRLPRDLPELVRARIALLPEDERYVLRTASAMGDLFWDVGLERLMLGELSLTEIDLALGRLAERGLIRPHPAGDMADAQAYRFDRRLVANAIYAGLPDGDRRRYHRRSAAWLAALPAALSESACLPVASLSAWHENRAASFPASDDRHPSRLDNGQVKEVGS